MKNIILTSYTVISPNYLELLAPHTFVLVFLPSSELFVRCAKYQCHCSLLRNPKFDRPALPSYDC